MPTPDQFVTICMGIAIIMLAYAAIIYAGRR